MHRRTLLAIGLATFATPALTALTPYQLGGTGAAITYTFMLNGSPIKGTVPVDRADLSVDPDNLAASTANVTADVRRAETGLIFATQALKSASVLDADSFPLARFQSTRVILGPGGRISDGATIEGRLTLRGVTRPMRFDASLFRPAGTASDDLKTLIVALKAKIDRRSFGATGFPDLVDDIVAIDINAQIDATV